MINFVQTPLVEAAWLWANIEAPDLRIVDARWRGDGSGLELYRAGHIPGAVHLDWERDLSTTRGGIRFLIPTPNEFAGIMERNGIGSDTHVVVYADLDYSGAARLWWALRMFGHRRVAVLDGGFDQWVRGQFPVSTTLSKVHPATFTTAPSSRMLATLDEVKNTVESGPGGVKLVDTRPIEQFEGRAVWTQAGSLYLPANQAWVEVEGCAMKAGHIPGAIHLPSPGNLDPVTWRYLTRQALVQRAASAGLELNDRIITYCGCGISASLGLFALHLAGYQDLALYDASWEEWGTDPNLPLERD